MRLWLHDPFFLIQSWRAQNIQEVYLFSSSSLRPGHWQAPPYVDTHWSHTEQRFTWACCYHYPHTKCWGRSNQHDKQKKSELLISAKNKQIYACDFYSADLVKHKFWVSFGFFRIRLSAGRFWTRKIGELEKDWPFKPEPLSFELKLPEFLYWFIYTLRFVAQETYLLTVGVNRIDNQTRVSSSCLSRRTQLFPYGLLSLFSPLNL